MRASLQSLPREQLDPDFTRRVMERIAQVSQKPGVSGKSNGQLTGPLSAALAPHAATEREAAVQRAASSRRSLARHPLTWVVALVATLLLAVVLAPNHLGLPWGGDGGQGTIGAVPEPGNGQNIQENGIENPPVGPESALAGNEGEMNEGGGELPAPQGDDPPQRLVNNPQEAPEPKNPSSRSSEPAPENDPSPQIARTTPNDAAPTLPDKAVSIPLADFAVNYASPDLHVIRMTVSPESMRSRALDAILEEEGISFHVAGAQPELETPERGQAERPVPEFDVLLVHGAPRQLDGVFGALKKRPDEFRPLAVYTAPQKRFFDWFEKIAEYLLTAPIEPPAPRQVSPRALPGAPDSFSSLLELSTNPTNVFAWRAPPLNLQVLDTLFPVPAQIEAAINGEGPKTETDPTVQVIFILFPGK
jgi:hypothetical protein